MNSQMTAAAVERLSAQIGQAIFGEPVTDLIELANRCNALQAATVKQSLTAADGVQVDPDVLSVVSRYVGKTSSAYRYIAEDLATLAARRVDEAAAVVTTSERFCFGKLRTALPEGTLLYAALPAQQPAKVEVHSVIQIGAEGKAYDRAESCRAYTYSAQPGNDIAWRLGVAAAAAQTGGDPIDYGLSLLQQLQKYGFGVFQIAKQGPNTGAAQPAQVDLGQFREAVEHWRRDLASDYKGGHIDDGGAAMEEADRLLALIDRQGVAKSFQAGVSEWMAQCFVPSLYSNMTERGDRLLEETLELLQAHNYDPGRVATLVRYVYSRPVGAPAQEVGGVMVTLAGYCWIAGLDMHAAGDAELRRITQPEVMAKIRAKQEAKNALHFDTPLPGGSHG